MLLLMQLNLQAITPPVVVDLGPYPMDWPVRKRRIAPIANEEDEVLVLLLM